MKGFEIKVGNPYFDVMSNNWALIEKINNEYHAGYDSFVDIVTLRWADGHQTRHTAKELKENNVRYFVGCQPWFWLNLDFDFASLANIRETKYFRIVKNRQTYKHAQNMKTRQQYLDKEITHENYYSQFVDYNVKKIVLRNFTKEQLYFAFREDKNFNYFDLKLWDSMVAKLSPAVSKKLNEANDFLSLATGVCILKQAAREIVFLLRK